MHGDSATLEGGVEDNKNAQGDEEEEQRDGDTDNIEDAGG